MKTHEFYSPTFYLFNIYTYTYVRTYTYIYIYIYNNYFSYK
ncbi:hypothetical protein ACMBCM_09425 [Spiroplasma sp. K1]